MRVQFPWIVLLLAAALLAGCRSDEAALAEHFERAESYREAEQHEESIIEYKNVLQIDPNHADAHFGLSQAYLNTGRGREGFWQLRETVRLDPDNHEAVVQFAQISIYAGELEEALRLAEGVIEADPSNDVAWLIKGQAHEALKAPAEAMAAFEQAAEANPESEAALLVLANYHRRHGDRATAGPLFESAAEKLPTPNTWLALASFYAEDRDRSAEAEAAYRKGMEISEGSDLERSYNLLGNFLYSRDRFDDAVATLEEGIEKVEDPLELIYLLARMHRSQGNTAEADELAERATQAKPDDPRPFLVLSSYRGRQGDLAGALEAVERALDLDPDDRNAQLRKAEVSLELGFRDGNDQLITDGRTLVDDILADEPSNPGGLFVQAKLDLAAGKPEPAIQALRSAIDVRPNWAEAHFLLGTTLALAGQRSAARTELARALEIDASLAEARRVLTDVHAQLGEHEYAVEEGRRYLETKPEARETRVRVAQSLVLLGRVQEARAEVEAIPEDQRDVHVKYALGRIYSQMGDDEKARSLLLSALEDRPNHTDILRSLLQLDEKAGRREEGLERIGKAVAENPDDAKLQQLAGLVALAQGDVEGAIAALNRAREIDPDDMTTYRQLADVYVRTGRTSQTIETYQKALEIKPDQPRIHHFLGVLFEFGGDHKKAVEHYEQAIRYAPDLAEAKNNLAYIYAEAGENLDRALDLAQDAKALLPDDPNTADTLGWVLYRRGVPSAAIGYLKEAEAGIEPSHANLGLIRHHLAMAYDASGDKENARNTADRAIEARQTYVESQKAAGRPVGADPKWYAEAQELRERL